MVLYFRNVHLDLPKIFALLWTPVLSRHGEENLTSRKNHLVHLWPTSFIRANYVQPPPTKFFPYAGGCIRNTPQQTLLLRLMAKSTTQNAKRLTKHKRNRKQTNCKNRINRTDFSGSALHRWKSMMKGIISSLSLFLSEKTWHSIFVKVGSLESGLRVVPKDCRDCKRMREESQVPFSSRDSKEWSARFFNPLSCAMLLRPLPAFSRAQYKWRNWHVRYQSQF